MPRRSVTKSRVSAPPLVPGVPSERAVGNEFGEPVGRSMEYRFEGEAGSYVLRVTGHDVDYDDEIRVEIDGALTGFLSPGPNEELNGGDEFAVSLAAGSVIRFENRSKNWMWGVTDVESDVISKLFIKPFSDLQTAIDQALEEKGKDASVLFLMDGGLTVPMVD